MTGSLIGYLAGANYEEEKCQKKMDDFINVYTKARIKTIEEESTNSNTKRRSLSYRGDQEL